MSTDSLQAHDGQLQTSKLGADNPRKPELPLKPKATDNGRSTIGPGIAFPDQQAFDAAMAQYIADKLHYDTVLYPQYRAEKKRLARPQDDGARAVQRRRDNPDAAGNHRR
eukprot:5889129-Prymnesium_polylepis.1